MQTTLSRVLAGCLGAFCLLNLAGDFFSPGFDTNIWWIDCRFLPRAVAFLLFVAAALFLLVYAARPEPAPWRSRMTRATLAAVLLVAAWNSISFFLMLKDGRIRSEFPFPFTLLVVAGTAFIFHSVGAKNEMRPSDGTQRWRSRGVAALAVGALAVCLPLAQIVCFGKTDYRRRADAIVVFGARAYADGRPSDALADRVRTACDAYHEGLAPRLIFSGGPGDGDIHETEAMRGMALGLGVPDAAIQLDRGGVDTYSTVSNTTELARRSGVQRILAVSHFYHLPRIKLAYQRAGMTVYTVPARESYTLTKLPYFVLREVAALWLYYLRPLAAR